MTSPILKNVALVTGAGSGIGRSVALALSREGYAVVLAGRRANLLEETAVAARGRHPGATVLTASADVTDEASVARLFAKLQQEFGRLDLLFNNAGMGAPPVLLEELALEQWNAVV